MSAERPGRGRSIRMALAVVCLSVGVGGSSLAGTTTQVWTGFGGMGMWCAWLGTCAPDPEPEVEIVSEVIDRWGHLEIPGRIAIDPWGTIYVSDYASGLVHAYYSDGSIVGFLEGLTTPSGIGFAHLTGDACNNPRAHTRNARGRLLPGCWEYDIERVFVADADDGGVHYFDNGELVGALGDGPGEFGLPNGVAVSGDVVYVVDSLAHAVVMYDIEGAYLGQFGSPGDGDGQLQSPTDLAIDETYGELYVADFNNRRVAVFNFDGAWLRNLSPPPNDAGGDIFMHLAGLGVDPVGNLYVVDHALGVVAVMDRDGGLVDAYGYQSGQYWTHELNIPIDAASDGFRVYVTSSSDGRVHVFEVAQ